MNYGTTRAVVGSYACVANDQNILCDATAGAANVTLPTMNLDTPRTITVWKTDASANAITILAPAGYTIASAAGVIVGVQNESISVSIGPSTVWYVGGEVESEVTLQGNTFNGVSQLVKTDAGGLLPAVSGASLTNLNGTNIATGTVADARLSANIPVMVAGVLPAVSGANLTNVAAADSVEVNGFAITQSAANADVVAAGVVTPANAAYVQAEITALADAVLELKLQLNSLQAKLRTAVVLAP